MNDLTHLVLGTATAACLVFTAAGRADAQDWTGRYMSIGIGQADSTVDWTAGGIPFYAPSGYEGSGEDTAPAVSFEFGQMYGTDALLYGWAFGLTHMSHDQRSPSPLPPGDTTFATEIGTVLTASGRIGRAWGDWLAYAEAGVAWARMDVPHSIPYCAGGDCTLSLDGDSFGLLGGVGVDYRLNDRYAVGLNYRYMSFDKHDADGTALGLGAPQSYKVGGEAGILSLRLTVALD